MTKQQLKEYCDAEFENIASVLSELATTVMPGKLNYSIVELAAIATFVHNFYNGVENIFKRIFSYKQIETKDTPTWHKDLLKMSLDSGIISDNLYGFLSRYLSFRHFFVHTYSFTLRWEEIKPLADNLGDVFELCKSEIYAYIDKLN